MNRLVMEYVEQYRGEFDFSTARLPCQSVLVTYVGTLHQNMEAFRFLGHLEIDFVNSILVYIKRYEIRLSCVVALPRHKLGYNAG